MCVTSTISTHDNIQKTIVLHGIPFLLHIQQVLPTVPQTSASTRSSSYVFCLPGAVPWAQALDAGFSALKPRFNRSNAKVEIVVNVTMGKGFLRILRFAPVSIIPPMLQSHLHLSPTLHKLVQLTASSHNAPNKPFLVIRHKEAKTVHKGCHLIQEIKVY
jgi:hypothetical protein